MDYWLRFRTVWRIVLHFVIGFWLLFFYFRLEIQKKNDE